MPEQMDAGLLRHVLQELNWESAWIQPDRYEVWASPDDISELILPLNPVADDFKGLMDRATKTLRSVEGTRFESIEAQLKVMQDAGLKTTQWKKETALPPGLIEWEQGEQIYELAGEQLAAAAKGTVDKRRYHGNRSSYLAKKFLANTYMGVPGPGSYIVTALTPVNRLFYVSQAAEHRSEGSREKLLDPERVSGSDIIQTFTTAMASVVDALSDYSRAPRVEPFLESVQDGVSYEFVKSLAGIISGGDTLVTVSREMDNQTEKEFHFEAHDAQVLNKARDALSQDASPTTYDLVGEVTLLSRETGGGERVVRLDVASGSETFRKARIRLSAEWYALALEAHRTESLLRVRGMVEREHNLHWMYSPETVEIMPLGSAQKDTTKTGEQGDLLQEITRPTQPEA